MLTRQQRREMHLDAEREAAHYETGKGSWVAEYDGISPQKNEKQFLTITVPEGSEAQALLEKSNYKFTTRKFGTITFSYARV